MVQRPSRRRAPEAPVPFWNRLPAFMVYPLRGTALVTLITLTLCTLVRWLPGLGWLLSLLVWAAIYAYAFDILRNTADGRMEAPEILSDSRNGMLLRLLGLILVLAFAVAVAFALGGLEIGLVVLVAVVLLQPGFVISLAMDGSLRRALNPGVAISLAMRIGWPYLAAFGVLFAMQASMLTAANWAKGLLPPVLDELALTAVTIWGLFATFHFMGYLVYQYHEVLGYAPETHGDLARTIGPDQRVLEEAEAHVAEGRTDTALEILRAEVRSRAVGLEVHALYQRLLARSPRKAERLDHARQYLNALLLEKQDRQALALLHEAVQADPDFVPLTPEQGTQLAARAQLTGQPQLAMELRVAMLKAWPGTPDSPQWALDAALLMAERYGRDADALALLEQALARCQDDEPRRRLLAAQTAIQGVVQPSPIPPAPAVG
ncbi:hypothetical protein [Pseudoxanthomonas winnipegensis]|uniref:Tetratricopeptide repeat protein n=1 Tax=Pseudoxanthomonas winnipegensis TaxID=2480810 RepID=A0A4Q8LXA7_9GAMM|nr:hypothetical protein [Pseudoxanthomonas winnipegensis]RZZ90677.1 hypothetical protein EA663_02695 [Pseudoxanthomonas winnipegensis]TAA37168.1 hypothetical protein EA656_00355 [Pseudoxanthomonas winnipegensis]